MELYDNHLRKGVETLNKINSENKNQDSDSMQVGNSRLKEIYNEIIHF